MKRKISKVGARLTGKHAKVEPEKPKQEKPKRYEKKSVKPDNELFGVGDTENIDLDNYLNSEV